MMARGVIDPSCFEGAKRAGESPFREPPGQILAGIIDRVGKAEAFQRVQGRKGVISQRTGAVIRGGTSGLASRVLASCGKAGVFLKDPSHEIAARGT